MGSETQSKTTRKTRLAKALRENLKRRKAQARHKANTHSADQAVPAPTEHEEDGKHT